MCEGCGGQIEGAFGRGRSRRFCLGCRPRAARTVAVEPVPAVSRDCKHCGEAVAGPLKKFCSRQCIDLHKRIPCAGCGEPIHHSRTSRPVGEARCNVCTRSPCGTAAAYKRGCRCIDCRRANAASTRKYLPPGHEYHWIKPADRVAIYDRDGWTCQLCMKPVDLTVHHLHRAAPTLDHIEPQSFALIPNHDPSNLRTACRGCNSARGNRVAA